MKRRGRQEAKSEASRDSSPEVELQAGGGGSGIERRQLRPRPALNYSDQHPLLDAVLGRDEDDGKYGDRRRLDVARFCALVEHAAPAQRFAAATHPAHVTVEALAASGLREPIYVPAGGVAEGGLAATRAALGLQLPPEGVLTPRGLAEALGDDHPVPTIDVATQGSGPTLTAGQLAQYLERVEQGGAAAGHRRRRSASPDPPPPPARLLNVVSLALAGTPLEDAVGPPWAVRGLDLVSAVWPRDEDSDSGSGSDGGGEERPETLQYALLGPGGAFTDWHVDMGGSAVWYHMLAGRKVFLAAPPTAANLAAFEEWSTSGKQASTWLGDELRGLLRLELRAGDTLLLPSGWPHAVSTPQAAVAVGGNFLTALDFGSVAACYRRERRLGVALKFQFPLFRRLMWHAAESALDRLQRLVREGSDPAAAGVTPWELGGLPALLSLLREWLHPPGGGGGGRRAADVPARVADPAALLQALQGCLAALGPQQQQQQQRAEGQRQERQRDSVPRGGAEAAAAAAGDEADASLQLSLALALADEADQGLGLALALAMSGGGGGGGGEEAEEEEGGSDGWLGVPPQLDLGDSLLEEPTLLGGAAAAATGSLSGDDGPGGADEAARAAGLAWAEHAALGGGGHAAAAAPPVLLRGRGEGGGLQPLQMVPVEQTRPREPLQHAHGSEPAPLASPRTGAGSTLAGRRRQRAPAARQAGEQALVQAGEARRRGARRGAGPSDSDGGEWAEEASGCSSSSSGEDEAWLLGQAGTQQTKRRRSGRAEHKQQAAGGQQQPARRRLAKAGDAAAKGGNGLAPSAAGAAGGKPGAAARGPASRPGSAAGRRASEASAPPVAPPPPPDLQPLGRKHAAGPTTALGRRQQAGRGQQAAAAGLHPPSQLAPRPEAARGAAPAAAGRSPSQPRQSPQSRRRARSRSRSRSPRAPAAGGGGAMSGREAQRRREEAEELLQEVAALQAAAAREEELLARVRTGQVSLPDGGAKLAAALEQRRTMLKSRGDAAAGRVLTFRDPGSGAVQGPFTPSELEKLVRVGLAREDLAVAHPQRGTMPLAEALQLPEPLSARLLREREAEQQQQRQQPEAAQPRQPEPCTAQAAPASAAWGDGGAGHRAWLPAARGGGGRGRSRAWGGWEERRWREEMDEQLRREAEAEAEAEAEVASGLWTYVDASGQPQGPFTVAELRERHRRGEVCGDEDILVHEEEQGVSMRIFALLRYDGLAEAAAARRRAAEAHAAAAAAAAAAAEAERGLLGRQRAWQGGIPAMGSGREGVGRGEGYAPSPAYSPPPAPIHPGFGSAGVPQLYSPTDLDSPARSDLEEDGREGEEEQQQPSPQPGPPQPTWRGAGIGEAPPSQAAPGAAGNFPAGFAPQVVPPESALQVSQAAAAPASPSQSSMELDEGEGGGQGAAAHGEATSGAGSGPGAVGSDVPPPPPLPRPMRSVAQLGSQPGAPAPAHSQPGVEPAASLPPWAAAQVPAPSAVQHPGQAAGPWQPAPAQPPVAAYPASLVASGGSAPLSWQQQQQQQQPFAGAGQEAVVASGPPWQQVQQSPQANAAQAWQPGPQASQLLASLAPHLSSLAHQAQQQQQQQPAPWPPGSSTEDLTAQGPAWHPAATPQHAPAQGAAFAGVNASMQHQPMQRQQHPGPPVQLAMQRHASMAREVGRGQLSPPPRMARAPREMLQQRAQVAWQPQH